MKTYLFYPLAFLLVVLTMVISCKKTSEPTPFSITSLSPEQGIIGTAVMIQGEGFATDPSENVVKFNGTTATVTAASATQLTTSVPTGAKTGRVTVEASGKTATSANDFVVIQEPYITSFAPAQAEEGDEVTIMGSGFKKGTLVVKFNGINATVFNASSDNKLVAIVPDGATTGKISVEGNGNTSTSSTDFTVVIPLTAKATVTKLAGIPAYPTNGADGVRMTIAGDYNLLITGPGTGQQAVYKLDVKTFGVKMVLTNITSPTGISAVGNELLVGGRSEFYYYPDYTNPAVGYKVAYTGFPYPFVTSLKFGLYATANTYRYVVTGFSNEIMGIQLFSNGTHKTTILNDQLKGIPNDASAMLATTSKNIYVSANNAIWKLGSDNKLQLIAGASGQKGYVDGKASDARFQDGGYARGNAIAVDEKDNVYVADYGCGCIRKVDGQGNVTTVVGKKTATARVGKGNQMRFNFDSWDIALNNDGTLYVIATNDVSNSTQRFAVYKVVFEK